MSFHRLGVSSRHLDRLFSLPYASDEKMRQFFRAGSETKSDLKKERRSRHVSRSRRSLNSNSCENGSRAMSMAGSSSRASQPSEISSGSSSTSSYQSRTTQARRGSRNSTWYNPPTDVPYIMERSSHGSYTERSMGTRGETSNRGSRARSQWTDVSQSTPFYSHPSQGQNSSSDRNLHLPQSSHSRESVPSFGEGGISRYRNSTQSRQLRHQNRLPQSESRSSRHWK